MKPRTAIPLLSVCCASVLGTPAASQSWDSLPGHPRIMLLAGEESSVLRAAADDPSSPECTKPS